MDNLYVAWSRFRVFKLLNISYELKAAEDVCNEVEEVYNEDIIYNDVVTSVFHLVHVVCMFILTKYNWPEPYE